MIDGTARAPLSTRVLRRRPSSAASRTPSISATAIRASSPRPSPRSTVTASPEGGPQKPPTRPGTAPTAGLRRAYRRVVPAPAPHRHGNGAARRPPFQLVRRPADDHLAVADDGEPARERVRLLEVVRREED